MTSNQNSGKNTPVTHLRPTKPCPICQKNSQHKFHPFCSLRCANIDLNRWLSGSYAIPVSQELDEDDEIPGQDFNEE